MDLIGKFFGSNMHGAMVVFQARGSLPLILRTKEDVQAYRRDFIDRLEVLKRRQNGGRFWDTPARHQAGNEVAQTFGYELELSGEALNSVRDLNRRMKNARKAAKPILTEGLPVVGAFLGGPLALIFGAGSAILNRWKYNTAVSNIRNESDETLSASFILERYAITDDGSDKLYGVQCWYEATEASQGGYHFGWHTLSGKPSGLNAP